MSRLAKMKHLQREVMSEESQGFAVGVLGWNIHAEYPPPTAGTSLTSGLVSLCLQYPIGRRGAVTPLPPFCFSRRAL